MILRWTRRSVICLDLDKYNLILQESVLHLQGVLRTSLNPSPFQGELPSPVPHRRSGRTSGESPVLPSPQAHVPNGMSWYRKTGSFFTRQETPFHTGPTSSVTAEPRSLPRVMRLNSPFFTETVAKVSPVSSEDDLDVSITSVTREGSPEPAGPRQSTRDRKKIVRYPNPDRS